MTARVLELQENQPLCLAPRDLSPEEAKAIWQRHGRQVQVEAPSPFNNDQWRLLSHGWAGHVPVTPDLQLSLLPKVPIASLFGMLEYAYRLGDFREGLVQTGSLAELYESLALVLARRVLDRCAKGLYRVYEGRSERCSCLRGRIDVRQMAMAPWDPYMHCHYQEHTADAEDNQILAWTLYTLARAGVCSERTLPTVRRAYRQLSQAVSLQEHPARACLGRLYNRLSHDYRPLHALCRFFLDCSGPTGERGENLMLPFLIDMDRLFEVFVAEWLAAHEHEAPDLRFRAQHEFVWDPASGYRSRVDLLGLDPRTGEVTLVLDTKYKAVDAAAHSDIYQVAFYALALGCPEAVLIYPAPLTAPVDVKVDTIRVRTLCFPLDGDLDAAGSEFLSQLSAGG